MPPNTVVVARPSKWGNPHLFGEAGLDTMAKVVAAFETDLRAGRLRFTVDDVRAELAGRNLACWCGQGPCHADVLLEVANQ